jgi:NitT/TauT family transport system substrate-binding protein
MERESMSLRHRVSTVLSVCSLTILLTTVFAACGSPAQSTSQSGSSSSAHLKNVTIGLGYNADIQFAPFYVAASKGYYKDYGLNVTFNNSIVPDLIGAMVAGKDQFVLAGGDDLLQARDKGITAVDTGTIFEKYAISLIVPKSSSIKTLADLKGHTIGIPGEYGSDYTGLLALLYSAHLTTSDVKLESVGFNQVAALLSHKVDAIVGYSNNEALQLQNKGVPVNVFISSDYQPLVSNGLVTMASTITNDPQEVKGIVQATLHGLQDVVANPNQAMQISKHYVPGIATTTSQTMQVLQATIPIWTGNETRLGYTDPATMASMEQFMVAEKMIKPINNLSQTYTNQFVPQ